MHNKFFKILSISLASILLFNTSAFANNSNLKHKTTTKKQLVNKNKKTKIDSKKNINKKPQKFSKKSISHVSTNSIKYSVFNYTTGETLEEKSSNTVWSIASLTKLMTAYVFVHNTQNINVCSSSINDSDTDLIKNTKTRLAKNYPYSCEKLLQVMLIASDNYAASALSRSVPGWSKQDFIYNMNLQAKNWGLNSTKFVDSSGLSPENKSTVNDYKKLTMNVVKNKYISEISSENAIATQNKYNETVIYKNSNKLVRELGYGVFLSKTGHIKESGYNLVHLSDCNKNIGIIEFGAKSSESRARFVKDKLDKYGCNS